MKFIGRGLLLMLTVALSGCTIIQPVEVQSGHFYLDPSINFGSIGKVAILELDNQSTRPEQTELLTQSIADALGKKHLFSVQCIYKLDSDWQSLELDAISGYTFEQLALIREQLHVDAVLFGTICRYSPYPHFLTHLRLKMVSLQDGKLIWAMEEVWDSTDKKTTQRMQQFFNEQMRDDYEPMNWQILVTSPRAFSRFVAFEVSRTLPDIMTRPMQYTDTSEKSDLFSGIMPW